MSDILISLRTLRTLRASVVPFVVRWVFSRLGALGTATHVFHHADTESTEMGQPTPTATRRHIAERRDHILIFFRALRASVVQLIVPRLFHRAREELHGAV